MTQSSGNTILQVDYACQHQRPTLPKTVIVIRTHYVDRYLLDMADSLSRSGHYLVIFAVDETKRTVDTQHFPKLSLTTDAALALNLHIPNERVFYYRGDYVFYLLLHYLKEFDQAWMIENDVFIGFQDQEEPFRILDSISRDDLLVTHLGIARPDWFWRRTMTQTTEIVLKCFFPVVRLTKPAISALYDARVIEGERDFKMGRCDNHELSNDEAFVATMINHLGYVAGDIASYGDFYDAGSFGFQPLLNSNFLRRDSRRLFHSAKQGRNFLRSMSDKRILFPSSADALLKADPELEQDEVELAFQRLGGI